MYRPTAGSQLGGKLVIASDLVQEENPTLYVVTRIWRTLPNGTVEYATHTYNADMDGCSGGSYNRTLVNAGEAHKQKVERLSYTPQAQS